MSMRTELLAIQTSFKTATTLSPIVPVDFPVTEHQIAELRESWLEHQIKPISDNEKGRVPFSALND
jgi:hypothetical protein